VDISPGSPQTVRLKHRASWHTRLTALIAGMLGAGIVELLLHVR
jgi:hypothetical protein